MRKVQGEKANTVNMIFGVSMFLLIGILRPALIYFYNIDIIRQLMVVIIVALGFILFFVKECKKGNYSKFDRCINIFIVISIIFISRNEISVYTPILAIITCIVIYISHSKVLNNINIKKYMSIFTTIITILLIYILFFYNFTGNLNEYYKEYGYKSCRIINELKIPENAKEINYKLSGYDVVDSIGYRIKYIDSRYDETPIYINELEKDGWRVLDVEFLKNKEIYRLHKNEKQVVIEIKKNSLIVGLLEDKQDHIKDMINKMSLDEKIGQMIVAGFNGTNINSEIETLVNDLKVGGVILFSRNVENSEQLSSLTKNIKSLSKKTPLFISIDEEGGRVSRLPKDTKKFKRARDIGNTSDVKYAYKNGMKLGNTLKEHNINMNFAPVLDIHSNPKNTVIGDRAFGNNENIVSIMGIATMNGIKESGVIPVVKHFPGHGDTEVDSHYGLPSVNKSLKELEQFELIPFKKAIDNECDAVMVSHILMENIDDKNPATLSKKVINDLLRNKMNFDGVVITDDMLMKAISNSISIEKASIKSINAGTDIILIGNDLKIVKSTINEIKLAVKDNEISEKRIDESVYRILKLKEKYDI
ncbi:beta-N-acetylhexosaminidase [Paraclostridium bifermentans]|uniref:beta-N-acetylhexosaminidase n=1 Tax=Paraclostridium bifermentans TaxID=1490 RepID=UPI00359C885A